MYALLASLFSLFTILLCILTYYHVHHHVLQCSHRAFNICVPTIFFDRILHMRLRPVAHKFSYPYVMIGVPVTGHGTDNNWMLSVDCGRHQNKRSWLHVAARDHFGRGGNKHGLKAKLDRWLKAEGVEPDNYKSAYLVTTPRMLGHHFTPASFWYLYTADGELSAVIAEVNNTFHERRAYFIPRESTYISPQNQENWTPVPSKADRDWFHARPFEKDFHVSPFNSRNGSYEVKARDPISAAPCSADIGDPRKPVFPLDVKVTLFSSEGRAKLYARIWSQHGFIMSPSNLSSPVVVSLVIIWGLLSRITYALIVIQALKLSFIRKLEIWHRPEPRRNAIAREATKEERTLALLFHGYLSWLADTTQVYRISPEPSDTKISIKSYHLKTTTLPPKHFDLTIHTPEFYSRMPGHSSISTFMRTALMDPWEENRTASSNYTEELLVMLKAAEEKLKTCGFGCARNHQTPLTMILGTLTRKFRIPAPAPAYPKGNPWVRCGREVRDAKSTLPLPVNRCVVEGNANANGNGKENTFLDAYAEERCVALMQWHYQIAIIRIFLWRWAVKLSGGILAWGN